MTSIKVLALNTWILLYKVYHEFIIVLLWFFDRSYDFQTYADIFLLILYTGVPNWFISQCNSSSLLLYIELMNNLLFLIIFSFSIKADTNTHTRVDCFYIQTRPVDLSCSHYFSPYYRQKKRDLSSWLNISDQITARCLHNSQFYYIPIKDIKIYIIYVYTQMWHV